VYPAVHIGSEKHPHSDIIAKSPQESARFMDRLSGSESTALTLAPEPILSDDLKLLPELEPWSRTFVRNVRDNLLWRNRKPLELTSQPGEFWPDVFVNRSLPWRGFVESGFGHALLIIAIWGLAAIWPARPTLTPARSFDRSQVIYFDPSEYLPPLDTGESKPAKPQLGDPELAKQPILSVPPEADNKHQTIVSPPDVRLTQDIATPNIVSWQDHSVPVPLAATNRNAPNLNSLTAPVVAPPPDVRRDESHALASLESNVVAPAPDVSQNERRGIQSLERSVVPPPPDAAMTRDSHGLQAPQASVVPPPPLVQLAAQRIADVTIAPSKIIAPAPQLAVPAQRSIPGLPGTNNSVIAPPPSLDAAGRSSSGARAVSSAAAATQARVIPPPPSTGQAGASSGAERLIALGIHPEAVPPPVAPGNRRGTFAATPEGKTGATGTPASATSDAASGDKGAASGTGKHSDAPAGLHVGSVPAPSAPEAGHAGSSPAVNPNLLAKATPFPASSVSRSRTDSSLDVAKTPLERKVFGDRRVYSMTLNMPNLNSAGGSWIIRFAESKTDAPKGDLSAPVAVHKVDPAYPLELMRQNVAGTVTLQAVIAADGTVEKVQVLQGVDDRLDHYACEALRHWQFFPATRNGNPVDLDAVVAIPFRPILRKSNF